MLEPNNLWVQTWQSATPLPAYRQKRIFDDTKEAEKVLHFFSNLDPSKLALLLMPLLLHNAIDTISRRHSRQPLARVSSLLQDAESLLAMIQHPSLDTLPLYQVSTTVCIHYLQIVGALKSFLSKMGCHKKV